MHDLLCYAGLDPNASECYVTTRVNRQLDFSGTTCMTSHSSIPILLCFQVVQIKNFKPSLSLTDIDSGLEEIDETNYVFPFFIIEMKFIATASSLLSFTSARANHNQDISYVGYSGRSNRKILRNRRIIGTFGPQHAWL